PNLATNPNMEAQSVGGGWSGVATGYPLVLEQTIGPLYWYITRLSGMENWYQKMKASSAWDPCTVRSCNHSLAMSVRWYIWSFGFCSVAKKYDSQIVLRLIVYRKSMALYSYF
ncbi:unnamed protein product, partial [Sphagnum jensenii]